MGHTKERPVQIEEISFPEESEYQRLRRDYSASAVVIPYKAVEAPAWDKHDRSRGPKADRFRKINDWGYKADSMQRIAQWTIFAVGAATFAPAVIRLVH
jgi:hypothetical protein